MYSAICCGEDIPPKMDGREGFATRIQVIPKKKVIENTIRSALHWRSGSLILQEIICMSRAENNKTVPQKSTTTTLEIGFLEINSLFQKMVEVSLLVFLRRLVPLGRGGI